MTMYGVWLPLKGWLRNEKTNDIFATESKEMAEQVAEFVGGRWAFLDNSVPDFESLYLAQERAQKRAAKKPKENNNKWHIFKSWRRKPNS